MQPTAPAPGGTSPAPQGAPQGAPQSGGASDLVNQINSSLMKLGSMIQQAGLKEDIPLVQQTLQSFHQLVQSLGNPKGQGGGGGPAPAPMPANSPVEAGGNPNARPM